MKITHRDGLFIAIATYEERNALSRAGFQYHFSPDECKAGPKSCAGCRANLQRVWWTKKTESAVRLAQFADDKAKLALTPHMKAVELSRATDSDLVIPGPPGVEYFPYQKAGISFMANLKPGVDGVLLGDEMGLGKTAQALGYVNVDKSIRNVLIVCPASLRSNWLRESRDRPGWIAKARTTGDDRKWNFHVVDKDEPIPDDANFVIANYNRVTVLFKKCTGPCKGEKGKELPCVACNGTGDGAKKNDVCGTCSGKKVVKCDVCKGKGKFPSGNLKLIDSLMARQWDLAAFDECHFIKNPKAARTKAVLGVPRRKPGIVDKARKKIFITGTPLPNKPIEMWPVLSVCVPGEFGSFTSFARRYADAHEEYVTEDKKDKAGNVIQKGKTVWKTDGASNLEELQEKLRSTCLIRRLKRDVLKDLPPKIRQVVSLAPTEKAKRLISEELDLWDKKFGPEREMIQEAIALAKEENDNNAYDQAVERLDYVQRIAFMEMAKMRHDVAVAKLPSVIEHLQGMFDEGVKKIICFAHHHDVIKALAEKFGDRSVTIYGGTKTSRDPTKDERQIAVDRFQADAKIKLFIGGIMAAGTGLTLTASSHVVFAELDWTPSNITQAEDRAHRIGQLNSVFVQHLVLDGSLDARMAQLLVEKQSIADRALDKSTAISVGNVADARPEVPVEAVAIWKKMLLQEAMVTLAQRRDPSVEGGHGFAKFDAVIGNKLATWKGTYSDKQAHLAIKLAKKYRGQLTLDLQKNLGIETPISAIEEKRKNKGKKKVNTEQTVLDFFSPADIDAAEGKEAPKVQPYDMLRGGRSLNLEEAIFEILRTERRAS